MLTIATCDAPSDETHKPFYIAAKDDKRNDSYYTIDIHPMRTINYQLVCEAIHISLHLILLAFIVQVWYIALSLFQLNILR